MSTPQDPFDPPRDDPSRPPSRPPDDVRRDGEPPYASGQYQGGQYGGQYGGQHQGGPYGNAPYGGQPYGAGPGRPKRNGLGIAALVVGLLALLTSITLVGGIVLGIVAIVLGVLGRGRAKRGEADNGGTAVAGLVLGVVGLLLSLLFLAIGVAIFSSDSAQNLIDCLEQAGDDQAAIEECQREFTGSVEQ
jgi:hypothetical protein